MPAILPTRCWMSPPMGSMPIRESKWAPMAVPPKPASLRRLSSFTVRSWTQFRCAGGAFRFRRGWLWVGLEQILEALQLPVLHVVAVFGIREPAGPDLLSVGTHGIHGASTQVGVGLGEAGQPALRKTKTGGGKQNLSVATCPRPATDHGNV